MASHVLNNSHVSVWAQLSHAVAERRARFSAWQGRRAYRARIARELYTYSERELFDLGIQRADIPAILNGSFKR
jgi:uncharacterized protein YjiS (DUF1127 family)